MPVKLKTDELPVAERRPVLYGATVAGFELRKTVNSDPWISVSLLTDQGQRRFDAIFLRAAWFNNDYDPVNSDPQDRRSYTEAIGARNRVGKVKRYLGLDNEGSFDTPEVLVATLNEVGVGKRFVCRETQRREKQSAADGQVVWVPTEYYRLSLADPERVPNSWKRNSINLLPQD